MSEVTAAVAYLRSPLAIRARCETILEAGLAGTLRHFTVDLAALPRVIGKIVATYPDAKIPLLARMSQFRAGGIDRVAQLDAEIADQTPEERARIWADLVIVSVLLDTDAGDTWKFTEPGTGVVLTGRDGVAVASLQAFRAGLFSSSDPLRADASGMRDLHHKPLADAFQVSADNPIVGMEARSKMIRALGGAVSLSPRTFRFGRLGGLVDALLATGSAIAAPALLQVLLEGFGPIWPDSVTVGDIAMGDVARHPAAGGSGPSEGLVPFHKLTQWAVYSLVEPLATVGITVQQLGALTALADKRSAASFVEHGVLVPRYEKLDDEVVTEWRALTVALLDRVADGVQKALGAELPLSSVLQLLSDGTGA